MKVGEKKLQIGNRCLTIKTKKIMKKNLFMVAAVALIATVSCNKEELGNNDAQGVVSDVVFVAELEQPNGDATEVPAPAAVQTKTALGTTTNGVTAVNWVANDMIKINGVEFKATAAGSRTDFTPTSSFTAASTYYAVYPASAAGASDLTKVTIPASQKGTFAEAAISVAKSSTQSLSFKNVASILKFQVPSACSTITIESNANLAGTFPVTFTNDLPEIGTVSSGSEKITLTGSFTTGKDYYVAVLPGSHKFTFRLDGYLSKASTKAVTTKRAVITNLKTLPALEASGWGVVGSFNSWDLASAITMYKDVDGYVLARNIPSGSFKFVKGKTWDIERGIRSRDASSPTKNAWNLCGTKDITLGDGTYDVYFIPKDGVFNFVDSGSDVDRYAPSGKKIYLQVKEWSASDAYFEAWVWGNNMTDAWYKFAMAGEKDKNHYVIYVPEGATSMKILRKDPNSDSEAWKSWNDSGNQTIPTGKDMFIENGWGTYSWGTYSE